MRSENDICSVKQVVKVAPSTPPPPLSLSAPTVLTIFVDAPTADTIKHDEKKVLKSYRS